MIPHFQMFQMYHTIPKKSCKLFQFEVVHEDNIS